VKRALIQISILAVLAAVCALGVIEGKRLLGLPFRQTNDLLHQRGAPITLDFLIPAATYVDERMTIGEVVKVRFTSEKAVHERWLRSLLGLIPERYRHLVNFLLFGFWFFCYMTFFRVFTFMGYGRAFRVSLLMAGVTYGFMPDLAPGWVDDFLYMAVPVTLVAGRWLLRRVAAGKRSKRA
jgi:hypothetical protein